MKRILVWSPNYAPELTGIPPLVTDAADWLAGRGHRVEVVTAVPNYPERRVHAGYRGRLWWSERRGAVGLRRTALRVRPGESFVDKVLYEASFAACSFPLVLRSLPQTDVLVCVVPSLAAAIAAAAAVRVSRALGGRPHRLVLWVQDLVLVAAAALAFPAPRGRRGLGLAERLEADAARAADRVVVCSPGFSRYLEERGVPASSISVVYNWVDADWITPAPTHQDGRPTRFLYAGNLGYTQGFGTLLEAVKQVRAPVEVELVGDGNAADEVRRLAATLDNVHVRPPVPRADFPALLASADAHVLLQRRAAAGANFPSKIASYLASGRPIIASMSNDVPATETLDESGAAMLVAPESPRELAEAMERLHADVELRRRLGGRGHAFSRQRFNRDAALEQLEAEILGPCD